MVQQQKSLYEQLGGSDSLTAMVNLFYSRVLDDPMLHHFFAEVAMNEQVEKHARFLCYALGGPPPAVIPNLREVHDRARQQGLATEHFDRVIEHLKSTLSDLRIPSELVQAVVDRVEATRSDVLGS